MNKEVVSFGSMRADHRHWNASELRWQADINEWQKDHEQAQSQLSELQRLVQLHGEALQSHAKAIEQCQQDQSEHDRAMSGYGTGENDERHEEVLAGKHLAQAKQLELQSEAHERIKKHHYTVIAGLGMLRSAIDMPV